MAGDTPEVPVTRSRPAPVRLGIVVPCYNETEVLPATRERLVEVLDELVAQGAILEDSFVCFVDDGSSDGTWEMVERFHEEDPRLRGIKLSRNRGHQFALWAGYEWVTGQVDCCASMDADLQDDPGVLGAFVERYLEGNEVVYGVRRDRASDSSGKRLTALAFYRLMKWLGCDIVHNHADCRLLGRRALENLVSFGEVNLFVRGLVPLVGLRSAEVYYDRCARPAGESKYPVRKMLAFALDGITSFSITPLRMVTLTGALVFLVSLALSGWVVWGWWAGKVVPGWASTALPLYLLGGVQILCIGLLGEYLGKVYVEVKGRPRYFVDKELP